MAAVAKFDVRPAAVEEWTSRRERSRQDRDKIQKYMQQEYVTSFFGRHTKQVNPIQPSIRFSTIGRTVRIHFLKNILDAHMKVGICMHVICI